MRSTSIKLNNVNYAISYDNMTGQHFHTVICDESHKHFTTTTIATTTTILEYYLLAYRVLEAP